MTFDPASLIFTPSPEMTANDLDFYMDQMVQANKHLDAFKADEINGDDLCDALEFFDIDPVEFEVIVDRNLDLMGF